MQRHTPGPWRADPNVSSAHPGVTIRAELPCINGLPAWFAVAHVLWPGEDEEGYSGGALDQQVAAANAAFIVRACNAHDGLLAAFKKLVSLEFDEGTDGQPLSHSLTTEAYLALEAEMRAAIAAPTGEQSR